MTSYIGPIGGLVAFKCPSDLVPSMSRPAVERVTTGGVVNVQVSPRTRREWRVDWGVATPTEIAGLAALVAGEFGHGPFWFVDPWAQVTNLLAPASSVLDFPTFAGLSVGGPVNLADGTRAGRSIIVEDPTAIVAPHRYGSTNGRVPVIPGKPVTGSIYAAGGGIVEIRLTWFGANGAEILPATTFSNFTPGGTPARIHRTATPPGDAVAVTVSVRGASRLARPAVTWTDKLVDWHVGQGAPSVAIPADLTQSIILAHTGNNGRLAGVSTTIREVG